MWRTFAIAILGTGILALGVPIRSAQATEGHCSYRQLAPKQRTWHRVCQMPATQQTCDDLVSELKEQLAYGDGDCNPSGAIGVCLIGASKLYFYQGDADALVTGCEMMHGAWRPDLMPAQ